MRSSWVAAAALLLAPAAAESMYMKSSPVLQVDAKSYDQLVAKSNHTTIVEFYAPWCGHCKNLKPAYEKAAEALRGLAKVAAINCDDEANKAFCGGMGVQGFPTLKIVKPGKKTGTPMVEDYRGERTAKAIVEAVKAKIPNHVKKVTDADLDVFLAEGDSPKALLFTEKGTISPTMKSLSVDFLGSIMFGQIRSKETKAVERLGITKFPTLVLLPSPDQEPVVYDGEMVREGMLSFLSQIAPPNADPAPKATKDAKKTQKAKEESAPPPPPPPSEQEPIVHEPAPALPVLETADALAETCLAQSSTCVLVLTDASTEASTHLADIAHKYALSQHKLFPIYEVPSSNPRAATLKTALGLTRPVELVLLNARRRWWKHYAAADLSAAAIESWVDALRMGEGDKTSLPDGVLGTTAAAAPETKATDPDESTAEAAAASTIPEPEAAQTPEPSSAASEPEPASEPSVVAETEEPAETPITHGEL